MTSTFAPKTDLAPTLQRVLRAIRRRREYGFHFPGNFYAISFDRVGEAGSQVSLQADCRAGDGTIEGTALGEVIEALQAESRARLLAAEDAA